MYRLILSVHFICSIRSVHLCHSDLCTVNYKKSPSELVYRKLLESYQLPKLPAHAFIKGPKQIHQKALLQELKQSQPSGPRSIRGCLSWLNAVAIGKFASASGKWINIKVWESGCRLNTCTVQVFFFIFFNMLDGSGPFIRVARNPQRQRLKYRISPWTPSPSVFDWSPTLVSGRKCFTISETGNFKPKPDNRGSCTNPTCWTSLPWSSEFWHIFPP